MSVDYQHPLDTQVFTKVLRESAMDERKPQLAYAMRAAADLIDNCIDNLFEERNGNALRDLNGAWAYAFRLLEEHRNPVAPTPPLSGAMREAKVA